MSQEVTPELRRWIVEQATAGFEPDAVLKAMIDAGWDEAVALTALEATLSAHLAQHHHDCDAKMRALEAQKNQANNNLAGATWVQSISTQMQAEATMCASRATLLQNHKDKLEQELRDLEATNP